MSSASERTPTPALFAWQMGETAGFGGFELDPSPEGLLADLPGGQHGRQTETEESVHFPDGNATLARLLVRQIIPGAVRVDYGALDRVINPTRIRLNSTVLNVRHDGTAASASEVIVSYRTAGELRQVRGRACVMACWNMFIPYLVLPGSRTFGASTGSSRLQRQGPARLYECVSQKLAGVRKARDFGCRLPDDVSRQRGLGGAVQPRRIAPRP